MATDEVQFNALIRRVAALESFNDLVEPGWRDAKPKADRALQDIINAPMGTQTSADAVAAAAVEKPVGDNIPPIADARRSAALAGLEEFHGSDAVPPLTGSESTEHLEGLLAVARARKADLEKNGATGA
jgi:hypothetical protein